MYLTTNQIIVRLFARRFPLKPSMDSGRFVMSQPLNSRTGVQPNGLPTAPELFPEIIEASLDNDDAPSCSALEPLERQEPLVNRALAFQALALLTRLFR